MTDLLDQLPALEAAARRLLARSRPGPYVLVPAATCHPSRPAHARGACRPCYQTHWAAGTVDQLAERRRDQWRRRHFTADYALLRSEGYTRAQIAERLGMKKNTLDAAYLRAVRAGDLTPDRRTA